MKRTLMILASLSLTVPALAADRTTKPRTAVLEFGDLDSSAGKPRIAVLEYGDPDAPAGQPRTAVLELRSEKEEADALTDGLLIIRYLNAQGAHVCTYSGGALSDATGTPLFRVVGSAVYAPSGRDPIYTYADGMLTDATGAQTTLVSESGKPLAAIEISLAVANRDGYCR